MVARAEQFQFEPYVDAQYVCNYLEGLNAKIPLEGSSVQEAVALATSQVGQSLIVGCNRDIYQCVHNHGDVEPRPVYRLTEERELLVIGGRILDQTGQQELAQLGSVIYHRNLKQMPKCKW